MIDLNELKKETLRIAKKREENGAVVKTNSFETLKHCATEVVEATQAYTEYAFVKESGVRYSTHNLSSELADVIVCVLNVAELEKIDIEKALLDCVEKNRKRSEKIGDKL